MKESERKGGKPRKLDQKKVLDMHARGFSAPEIAQQQGVAHSTVWRFLERMKPEIGAVEEFKKTRPDVLARIQAKSLDAQERIIDTLDDGLVAALKPGQKTGLLIALNTINGTAFDKERLERGQSTQNHSIVAKMLSSALSDIYKPVRSGQRQESAATSLVNVQPDGETQGQ